MKEFEIWNISRKPKQSGFFFLMAALFTEFLMDGKIMSDKYLNCDELKSKLAEIGLTFWRGVEWLTFFFSYLEAITSFGSNYLESLKSPFSSEPTNLRWKFFLSVLKPIQR